MPKIYLIHRTQELPISIKEAWNFFSSPDNLKEITPPYMDFKITSPYPKKEMYPGMIISYVVRPLLNIGIPWVTEITHVDANRYFVDEQRFGPFKFWHHQHHFTPTNHGVLMEDVVHYALPLGILGRIAHHFIIKKRLEAIFAFRKQYLETLYG